MECARLEVRRSGFCSLLCQELAVSNLRQEASHLCASASVPLILPGLSDYNLIRAGALLLCLHIPASLVPTSWMLLDDTALLIKRTVTLGEHFKMCYMPSSAVPPTGNCTCIGQELQEVFLAQNYIKVPYNIAYFKEQDVLEMEYFESSVYFKST